MSERNYWIVRPTINGFEFTVIMYATETELRQYLQQTMPGQVNYMTLTEEGAAVFVANGFKVYMCPTIKEEVREKTTTPDQPTDEDFMTKYNTHKDDE